MAYPTDKAALGRLISETRAQLEATLAGMNEQQLTAPILEGGWSAKDMMDHLAFWEQSMLDRIQRAAGGERIHRPQATDEQRSAEIDRINTAAQAAAQSRQLADVRSEFDRSYLEVLSYIETLSESQIFDPGEISAMLGYPAIQLIAGDTYEHYQEHSEALQAALKSQ
jgi:hypothetical protein